MDAMQVNADGMFRYAVCPWFTQALQLLVASGVYGVAVDIWVSEHDQEWPSGQGPQSMNLVLPSLRSCPLCAPMAKCLRQLAFKS